MTKLVLQANDLTTLDLKNIKTNNKTEPWCIIDAK